MLASILTTFFFAFSAVFGRKTALLFGSLRGNFWRLVLSALALGAATWCLQPASFASASFFWFFFSGVIGFGLGDVGLFLAYPRLGTRLTMLLNLCLAPVFGAIVEIFWLGTRISLPETAAALVILAGVTLALLPSRPGMQPRPGLVTGVICAVIAGFGQGAGAVISRQADQVGQGLGLEIGGISAAFQRVLGGLVVAFAAFLIVKATESRENSPVPKAFHRKTEAAFALCGAAILGPVIGVSFFQWALIDTPSALVLAIVATTPIVLIPIAWVLEKDVPTAKAIAGAVVAVSGVVWICLARGS